MSGPDDAVLVRRCLAGDPQAQRILVERYREAVWRLARNATGDPEEAFDLAQETFIAAFGALARYDVTRPFAAWVTRIALNKCRDWARRRAVRRLFEFAVPEGAESTIADDAGTPESVAGDRAEIDAVSRAVADLPPRLKEVLLLRTVEELNQSETAAILGISEKAVETRLYRARLKLSEIMRGKAAFRV